MSDQDKRGELSKDRRDEVAPEDPKPRPNLDTKDDGRGRDASRTGSDSKDD